MADFYEIMKKLCEPFSEQVKMPRQDGHGYYIPISHYIDRLNEVAGQHWSHERVGEPILLS
ncbi:hypothetical protein GN156_11160 [bacterium LRH843]|nr:hypothetical protein [bacterium LRH843]